MPTDTQTVTLYLIRHASPDWERKDIPYDVPPGPPLTQKGRQEAEALGHFLRNAGLRKLYHSPLERSAHTAQIAAALAGVPTVEKPELAEWRNGESEGEIQARFGPVLEACIVESALIGPIGLVTHGGPVAHLLKQLGMEAGRLADNRRRFDHANPMPPAGAWAARRSQGAKAWELELVFTPGQEQGS